MRDERPKHCCTAYRTGSVTAGHQRDNSINTILPPPHTLSFQNPGDGTLSKLGERTKRRVRFSNAALAPSRDGAWQRDESVFTIPPTHVGLRTKRGRVNSKSVICMQPLLRDGGRELCALCCVALRCTALRLANRTKRSQQNKPEEVRNARGIMLRAIKSRSTKYKPCK